MSPCCRTGGSAGAHERGREEVRPRQPRRYLFLFHPGLQGRGNRPDASTREKYVYKNTMKINTVMF